MPVSKYLRDKAPKKIKKVFVDNLQTVKDNSKNTTTTVIQHTHKLMKPFNSASSVPSSSAVTNITICKSLFIMSFVMTCISYL